MALNPARLYQAFVTTLSPLRVKLIGTTNEIPVTYNVETFTLVVGDRVLVSVSEFDVILVRRVVATLGWSVHTGRWRRTTNQSATSGTPLTISWDTEDDDPSGMMSVPGTTLTIPVSGIWSLQAMLLDQTGVVNARHMALFQVTSSLTGVSGQYRGNGYGDDNVGVTAVLPLAAADTVSVAVQQSSGVAHNYQARLAVSKVA